MEILSPLWLQEPPKEDLTVSEKFQLVLDVAQKAQVLLPLGLRPGGVSAPASPTGGPNTPGLACLSTRRQPARDPEAATLVGGRALLV